MGKALSDGVNRWSVELCHIIKSLHWNENMNVISLLIIDFVGKKTTSISAFQPDRIYYLNDDRKTQRSSLFSIFVKFSINRVYDTHCRW